MNNPIAVVLAAGKGTRMKSELPKVLCQACNRPLIEYVLDALEAGGVKRSVVVVGYRSELVRQSLASRQNLTYVEQTEQLGTGHAVQVCREELADHHGPVIIVTGDSPMLQVESIRALLTEFNQTQPACLLGTLIHDHPAGLGRIVRDAQGDFVGIVEEKDASPEQRQIREVNMSTYVFDCQQLLWALDRLDNNNQQGEFYITDCPGILLAAGQTVRALPVLQPCEALSVNTVEDLEAVEAELRSMC